MCLLCKVFFFSKRQVFQMSTCTGLAALDLANSRNAQGGYAVSGQGMGVCARHEFVQANGVGALQKGERCVFFFFFFLTGLHGAHQAFRYANMDYIFCSLLRHHDPALAKILSYDISCQYSVNFVERVKRLPPLIRLHVVSRLMTFVIPKLHIYGHTLGCQVKFNLNYTPGAGRTDAEGIERNWAGSGPIASSTVEMGPGGFVDTLDDHWSHWNWRKLRGLGMFILAYTLIVLLMNYRCTSFETPQAGYRRVPQTARGFQGSLREPGSSCP